MDFKPVLARSIILTPSESTILELPDDGNIVKTPNLIASIAR